MRKATNTAYEELIKQVREKAPDVGKIREDGWKTTEQWAAEWNKSTHNAGVLIRQLIRVGLWEFKKFPITSHLRGVYSTPHYRPKA